LIQSVKSPNAEPFKQWLAQVGATTLDETRDMARTRVEYRYRLDEIDRALHQMVAFRGVVTAAQHQAFTDANYQGLYDNLTESGLCDLRGMFFSNDDPRDVMDVEELGDNIFQRVQTRALIERRNIRGAAAVTQAAYDVGVEVRLTIARLGGTMPEDLPPAKRLSRGDYRPELQDAADTERTGEE
jgi:DNA-damage-inducible protein D